MSKLSYDVSNMFSSNRDPFNEISWESRNACIKNKNGETIYELNNIRCPGFWSQMAVNVAASKYFFTSDTKDFNYKEKGIDELINRVANAISKSGYNLGYFETIEDSKKFNNELRWLLVNQYGAFNSPVWFNVGLYEKFNDTNTDLNSIKTNVGLYHVTDEETFERSEVKYKYPLASACFIQELKDSISDIMDLAKSQAFIFKYGAGSGFDLSNLRSSEESVFGGGTASGPLSFMRIYDVIAGVVRSAGRIRRAAMLATLSIDHPDIKSYITCKTQEEKKGRVLAAAGYSTGLDGEVAKSLSYQNMNISVKVSDAYMEAYINGKNWNTKLIKSSGVSKTYKASELMDLIAENACACGDPGLQFTDTINKWNTCSNSGKINATNPCSEFAFLDNSACNLASLNLKKFAKFDGKGAYFDFKDFIKAIDIFITAQDILIDMAGYPTGEIAKNSYNYRPVGLGYSNLGALLMSFGFPYGSKEARSLAADITAAMTAASYSMSIDLAKIKGPFKEYDKNKSSMLDVINLHCQNVYNLRCSDTAKYLWNELNSKISDSSFQGFRNAQVTLLAPVGTIGFIMDCDTTGIEPEIALIKYKNMVGGGVAKLVNNTVAGTLDYLGYTTNDRDIIIKHIYDTGTIEGCNLLNEKHLSIFDCSLTPQKGNRSLSWSDHVDMMAAVQPFLSGAISKTVNLPSNATASLVKDVYLKAWKSGLKSITVYRDGSKTGQPLVTKTSGGPIEKDLVKIVRKRLPETRNAITHKFSIAEHEGYFTIGLYEDGTPGELFITISKEGSTIAGLMGAFGTSVSLGLQYGVPLSSYIDKFVHSRFEPAGITSNDKIRFASSIVDYIFKWVQQKFLPTKQENTEIITVKKEKSSEVNTFIESAADNAESGTICYVCGSMTMRNGTCFKCVNCGTSLGCS